MRTVCLSGWGQAHDALNIIAPDATHIDYAHAASVEEALRMIKALSADTERFIGWSLGGQLLARAVAGNFVMPRQLVLIATPYQFVQIPHGGIGMVRDQYDKFHENYRNNAPRTLKKAWELICHNDIRKNYIELHLSQFDQAEVVKIDWLRWLRLLENYSCDALDFSFFPRTLLVHGKNDVVVDYAQSEQFAAHMPHATLSLWDDCGHAPHWHDASRLQQLIEAHAHV